MSASRDNSQRFTFVYSNLYQIYRQGKAAVKESAQESAKAAAESAQEAPVAADTAPAPAEPNRVGLETARILKAEDLNSAASIQVRAHEPMRLLGKRIEVNRPLAKDAHRAEAVRGLRDSLKTLQGLHERLKFMLGELEELTKES